MASFALIKPTVGLESEYLAMIDEYREVGESYPYTNTELARRNFAAFIQELKNRTQGMGLSTGIPQQQTYWFVKDAKTIIGEIRLRPTITQPYEKYLGHIGYNIRWSQRGKGYAARQLALVLVEAHRLKLPGVMLTILGENPASARVIEKNGGKLLQEVENLTVVRTFRENGKWKTQDVEYIGERWFLYWIDLTHITPVKQKEIL